MAKTIREQIIEKFAARLKPLSSVPVGRAQRNMDDGPEKFISVWDGDDETESEEYGVSSMNFPIAIECIWRYGDKNPSVAANEQIGLIIDRMLNIDAGADPTFEGLAYKSELSTVSPRYPDDGEVFVAVFIVITIYYAVTSGNPYQSAII
ncbi:MAG: hypothetical protein PHT48_09555 [Dechloromonas sp.]|nr:hypothetical protein [Dechloromonas sp.]